MNYESKKKKMWGEIIGLIILLYMCYILGWFIAYYTTPWDMFWKMADPVLQ